MVLNSRGIYNDVGNIFIVGFSLLGIDVALLEDLGLRENVLIREVFFLLGYKLALKLAWDLSSVLIESLFG